MRRRRGPARARGALARRRRSYPAESSGTARADTADSGANGTAACGKSRRRPLSASPAAWCRRHGRVWVAIGFSHVRRRVAIKVVRTGLDSTRTLARFDQER